MTGRRSRGAARGDARFRRQALALDGARDRPLAAGFGAELATLAERPPAGGDWLHETKWDGYRLLVDLDEGRARLRSRNDLDWTARAPAIARAIEALPVSQARLDGELVALDAHGDSDFSALQEALKSGDDARLHYVVFDLPGVAGVDLTGVPLHRRKALLETLLAGLDARRSAPLALSTALRGDGHKAFAAAARRGLEGIVSKRADSPYAVGRRSRDWLKIKHALTDEFVVVGYTPPQGARTGFGSLLLASPERTRLRYVGRVGTGFDAARLRELASRLKALAVDAPVVDLPAHVPLPARRITWVRPQLVVEVAFRGWASQGLLRQASFLRVREDKGVADLAPARATPPRRASAAHAAAPSRAEPVATAARRVAVSHPERVVYPEAGLTKGDVAAYYAAVAGRILPELVDRPLALVRCPRGSAAHCFFQKHHAPTLGEHVRAVSLEEADGGEGDYVYIRDREGLLELVQMNTLEFHPWGARVDRPDAPDRLVFDLDPAPRVPWHQVIQAARDIRDRLAGLGLASFVRTSGGKGLHVVVPFDRGPDWPAVKAFCEGFAQALATADPARFVATASKARREGRIFVDWLRNARGATSVCSWSLRARAGASVAMPLRWSELGRVAAGDAYDLRSALRRAARLRSDPWPEFATLRQRLPAAGSA